MDEQPRESAAPANAGKLSPPAKDNLDLLNKFKDRRTCADARHQSAAGRAL